MIIVIDNAKEKLVLNEMKEAFIEEGILINSQQFDGLNSEASKEKKRNK